MKKYFLQKNGQNKRPHYPFWMPWGGLGCLGRILGFILTLALFLLLLLLLTTLPRSCSDSDNTRGGYYDPKNPKHTIDPNDPDDPGDSGFDPKMGEFDIPKNVRIKDDAPDNPVPPTTPVKGTPFGYTPDPKDIIPDPDPIRNRMIDQSHLFAIINPGLSQAQPALQAFCQEFTSLYPDCTIDSADEDTQMALLGVPPERRDEILKNLKSQITDVEFYLDVIEIFGHSVMPNEPAMAEDLPSWYFKAVKAPEGWDITKGKPEIKVAVIDSYFDLSHPEFKGLKIENPYSVERGSSDVSPEGDPNDATYYHGTHVLGTIAAQENGSGTMGIAPECTFIPISLGRGMNSFTLVHGVLYALHKGANVINVSIGLTLPDEIAKNMSLEEQLEWWLQSGKGVESAWDYVYQMLDKGYCTIVWSAGNNNLFELMDDSKRSDLTIKVEAVDPDLHKATFSNYGNIDFTKDGKKIQIRESVISAPGVAIFNTMPDRQLGYLQGTSMAAPIVTGAVALMKSVNPSLTNREIIDILQQTAKPIDNDSIAPMLQIGPALKAIKKDFSEWDSFEADPVGKLGLWKTASQLDYRDTQTNEHVYYAHNYLVFDSRNSGSIEVHVIGSADVLSSRFDVKWGKDEAILDFQNTLSSPTSGKRIAHTKARLYKDKDGKVAFSFLNPQGQSSLNLRRLKTDDRTNKN